MFRADGQMVSVRRGTKTKEDNMRKVFLLMLAGLFLMISTLGCNALRGAGKDVSDSGEHIQNVGK